MVATNNSIAYYMLFVFMASVGVLQLVAIRTELKGLLFFHRPALTYFIAFLALAGSFYWFFGVGDPMDIAMKMTGDAAMRKTSLEGREQFFSFCTAAFLAVVFTVTVSSLIDMLRKKPQSNDDEDEEISGLDALKNKSYFEAIKLSFKSKDH